MDKLKMHTPNIADEKFARLSEMFPNAVTETINENGEVVRAIDKDVLMQEIATTVVEGKDERYQFTWPDKKKSILLANSPISKTLRPCREESVDFDNTENLYIEGDNLDVLKLLQETYLGKVKMIYIDPPYNTGNDFIYSDNFSESAEEYFANSGQFDEEGNRLVHNTENNGRFHTDWLNMMYPRLKIARNLLSEKGCVFISIDDNEQCDLIAMCNEIFNQNNCLGIISNVNNPKGRSDDKFIATAHEYILVYAKDKNNVEWYGFEATEEKIIKRYNKVDEQGKKYREIDLRKTGENDLREDRPNLFYYFYYNPQTGDFYPDRQNIAVEGYIQIKPLREDGKEGNWRWGLDTAKSNLSGLLPKFMPNRKIWGVMEKDYLEGRSLVKPTSAWTTKDVNSERGTEQFINLNFDKRIFPKPKPIGTISRCIKLSSHSNEDIILDFFSGSATTAHAVIAQNYQDVYDGKLIKRKFIMVQLPELCDEKSEAYKAGYKNICEIGKERIRRAGKYEYMDVCAMSGSAHRWDMEKRGKDKNYPCPESVDIGFRVLKIDSSNMKDVYYNPAEFVQTSLDDLADNIKEDRTPEDLLFQVILDLGILLSSKIEENVIGGKKVFIVADNFLIACFDANVADETITEIAKKKPYYFVMRDSSMASDSVAANFEQIFKTYSPDTVRRVI